MTDLPILEIRRIEANIIKPIYDEMVEQLGREQAQEILGASIEKAAIEQGASMAAESADGPSLRNFVDLFERWKASGALEVDIKHEADERFDFNITRCRYSEMYKEMGMGDIGHLLSCGRDGSLCTGYDPRIKLERTQTIMGGASHCDFRYTLEE